MEQDQEFVEFVVKALVDHPTDVKTERVVDEMGVLITLHLNPEDMGQVIGRMGQTAKAIRTLLRVVGAKRKARVNLKIYEPEGSHRGPRREMGDRGGMGMGGHQGGMPMGQQSPAMAGGISDDSIDEFKL
jgi:predicted RNA-binding protein YlqC (UPF0109 family)